MAQDYHIYLHGNGKLKNNNNTIPFSNREKDESFKGTLSTGFNSAVSSAKSGLVNAGVSALAKVAPWVAVFVILARVTDKILSTGFAHQEEYTGEYKNNVMYNNFKTQLSALTHPIKTGFTIIHQQKQFEKQNKEIIQQNRLIGNSILKDFNVGV